MFRSTTTARRFCLLLILLAAGALCVPSSQSSASVPDRSVPDRSVPARSVPARNVAPVIDSGGYAWISYFRGLAGLGPVTRNSVLEAQEAVHVRYLADHSLSCESDVHDELTGRTGSCGPNRYATAGGKAAANNSDIARVSVRVSDRIAVQNWFGSAFHALSLLEPRLTSTGYAAYYTAHPAGAAPLAWQYTAGTDVYRGRSGAYDGRPVTFPATGAATPLLSYRVGTESPEPFRATLSSSPCHSWGSRTVVSAPVIAQWPVGSAGSYSSNDAPASIVDLSTGAQLATCALDAAQYPSGSLAGELLAGTNRVTRAALYYAATPFVAGHRYQVRVAGAALTTFTASTLPGAPVMSVAATAGGLMAAWTAAPAGSGVLSYYRLSWFSGAGCTGQLGTVTTTGRRYAIASLVLHRRYYLRVAAKNSLGAVRDGNCLASPAG